MVASLLNNPACEHVIDQPFTIYLSQCGAADESGTEEHLVCRLKNTLQMRRVSLGKRKLARDLPADSPGTVPIRVRPRAGVKSAGDRAAQRLIRGDERATVIRPRYSSQTGEITILASPGSEAVRTGTG